MIRITNNFFKDPFSVRKKAISLLDSPDSYTNNKWPGRRVDIPDNIKLQILSKAESITDKKLELGDTNFQVVDQSFMEGLVHCDLYTYTCVIFLNQEAPSNTGTEIYSDRNGNLWGGRGHMMDDIEESKRKFYESNRTFIDKLIFKRTLNKLNPLFKDPCVVSNKFNRGVIFNGCFAHRAQNFFGNNISNSRLTIASFLK